MYLYACEKKSLTFLIFPEIQRFKNEDFDFMASKKSFLRGPTGVDTYHNFISIMQTCEYGPIDYVETLGGQMEGPP